MDIQLNHISKRFGQNQVISDFDAVFQDGQISCLMGPSGIGKTTVINMLMGLMKPDGGEITGLKNRKIAAVFQEDRLIEHWNAVSNVKLVCDKTVTDEDVYREFAQVGLEKNPNKPVSEFSGGMRRRVAIVRAMLAESELVILDEPFKGLDEELKSHVIEYIKERTKGKTVIIVTHDKEDAKLFGARLVTIG